VTSHPPSSAWTRTVLLIGALLTVSTAPLRAQTCPPQGSITLVITRTTPGGNLTGSNQNAGLDGTVEVMFTQQGGWDPVMWASRTLLNVYGADGTLAWQNQTTTGSLTTGESYFDWNTGSMHRPYDPQNPPAGAYQPPVGDFQVEVQVQLRL
jgi:hypothetical protein